MINRLTPFEGKLGLIRANHLLRRTTFAIDVAAIEKVAAMTASEAVTYLFDYEAKYQSEPTDSVTREPFVDLYRGKPFKRRRNKGSKIGKLLKYLVGWWIDEAAHDKTIKSKLVFFLHTCFSVKYNQAEGIFPNHFYDHLQLMAKYSKKSYKELAFEMVVDNTMLEFLDNYTNSKENPNENFAREFLELFTIGKGKQVGEGNYSTYTEKDVITAAKLLTGFVKGPSKVNKKKEVFDVVIKTTPCRGELQFEKHDRTTKTFSTAFQNTQIVGAEKPEEMWRELQDFVDMIFSQRATAENICRKIYRYFVYRDITEEVEQDIIQPLSDQLIKNNYEIAPIIKTLLQSEHFFGSPNKKSPPRFIGSIIKSPLELTLNILSFFKVKTPNQTSEPMQYHENWYKQGLLEKIYIKLGFHPFSPQDVAGYPSYYQSPNFNRGWFSSSSIIGRYNFIEELIREKEDEKDFGGVLLDIPKFIKETFEKPGDAKALVSQLTNYLFPLPPKKDRFDYFLNQVLLDDLSEMNWSHEWDAYIKNNDDSTIKRSLNRLIIALVNAPEFQVL